MKRDYENAVEAVVRGFGRTRAMPPFGRAEILGKAAAQIGHHREEIARLVTSENAKPIRDALGEVTRAETTFAVAAEEARRIGGEMVPMDGFAAGKGKIAFTRRFPVGPVAAITPFNFPLNLVAHKVAPAIAAGCSVLVKPSPRTPKTAHKLVEILRGAGLPEDAAVVLEGGAEEAQALARDERFALLSFTGSAAVGWQLRAAAGKKKVCLELGGNAACIVHADADLSRAVDRLIPGCFAYSGQVCISTQRLYLHESIREPFLKGFLERAKALRIGEPLDKETDLGPMIDEAAARRAEEWIQEAVSSGAKALLGGPRNGRTLPPTVLEGAPRHLQICCEEVFAPVVVVESYRDFEDALRRANDSRYGLQASVFTNDLRLALRAHESLEVGAVLVNEVPGFRVDSMPYGGVKESGSGREGLRYAIEEMTEPRLLVVHAQG